MRLVTLARTVATLSSFMANGAAPMDRLTLSIPNLSLVDTPVSIRVLHATPNSRVSIQASMVIFGKVFESRATYVANASGIINTAIDAAAHGSYHGVDGMGLFWSMLPAAGTIATQGVRTDYLAPRRVTFRATNGLFSVDHTISRLVLSAKIQHFDIEKPQLFARFYSHFGRPRPTVIVLGGAEGGLPEDRPAILASHGYNTLALAYFGVDGLPASLSNIPVEDVRNAVTWLSHQRSVDATRIGIVGGSKGAELALVAASRIPAIKAVIAFSPSSVVYPGLYYGKQSGQPPSSWTYDRKPMPYVDGTPTDSIEKQISSDIRRGQPVSFAPEYLAELKRAKDRKAATIPVERINGPVLLVSGDDDRLWPSSYMAKAIMERMHAMHHPFHDVWLHYAYAGHEIGEPYYIYTDSTVAHLPRYAMNLGGSPEGNEAASVDAWPKVVQFLKLYLGPRRE